MTETFDPKAELLIQRGIQEAEDDLVTWVQQAFDQKEYLKGKNKKLEESQFRNLVRVATTTESPEVIKNFLRYQVGRDEKWGRGEDSLAEGIIEDIDVNLKTTANNISARVGGGAEKRIHIELIRRYLGYGARYLRYLYPNEKA